MYTTRFIPAKGQALVAEEDIKAGTRILEEELPGSAQGRDIVEITKGITLTGLQGLLPAQLQQFGKSLRPDLITRTFLVGEYLADYFDVDSGRSWNSLQVSCVNHSCCENAFFSSNLSL